MAQPARDEALRSQEAARLGESVLRDLLYMRKDAGFTAARIVRAPKLRQLLGGDQDPFEMQCERMFSAIQSLWDDEAHLLLSVFGLTDETRGLGLLKDRRALLAKQAGISIDTVASREAAALEHLRTQLLTGWYPKSPLPLRVPTSHNGVIQELVHVTTVVSDRKWQETLEQYRFVAAFDEADFIAISRTTDSVVLAEGNFRVETLRVGDSFTHRFFPPQPMRRGQTYNLSFRTGPTEGQDLENLVEESRAFHEPTRAAVFEVAFLGERPRQVWSYSGLTFPERPGGPAFGTKLHFARGSVVAARHQDLYGGLHSGIAWRW